jgi:hypothetical protein
VGSWHSQLGVDAQNAIQVGVLSGRPQFFGEATAETVARSGTGGSGWNGDRSYTVYSNEPWFAFSSPSNLGAQAGLFSPDADNGAYNVAQNGHRTILSGY